MHIRQALENFEAACIASKDIYRYLLESRIFTLLTVYFAHPANMYQEVEGFYASTSHDIGRIMCLRYFRGNGQKQPVSHNSSKHLNWFERLNPSTRMTFRKMSHVYNKIRK